MKFSEAEYVYDTRTHELIDIVNQRSCVRYGEKSAWEKYYEVEPCAHLLFMKRKVPFSQIK